MKSLLLTGVNLIMDAEHLIYWFDRYATVLVLYARQWCLNPEDVVQVAFWKLAQLTTPPQSPVAWLYRVVRNGALTQGRSERRRLNHEAQRAKQSPTWFIPNENGLDVEWMTKKLQELPIQQSEVIIAHIWGGLSFEQIAEICGSSAATCYRRYAAGLATLRDLLGELCPNPTER